jgi:hypothetical protein
MFSGISFLNNIWKMSKDLSYTVTVMKLPGLFLCVWNWGLNSGVCTCQADILTLEPHLQLLNIGFLNVCTPYIEWNIPCFPRQWVDNSSWVLFEKFLYHDCQYFSKQNEDLDVKYLKSLSADISAAKWQKLLSRCVRAHLTVCQQNCMVPQLHIWHKVPRLTIGIDRHY